MKVTIAIEFAEAPKGKEEDGLKAPHAADPRRHARLPAAAHVRVRDRPHGDQQAPGRAPRALEDLGRPQRRARADYGSRHPMSEAAKLLGFAVEGARVRRAAGTLEQASAQLASALRRAMPFLARGGAQVSLVFARAIPIGELLGDLPRPIHASHLVVRPGGARGAIVLDAGLIALILDGVLGGDGSSPPQLEPAGLSPPQVALIARVIDGVVRSFSEVLSKRLGDRAPRERARQRRRRLGGGARSRAASRSPTPRSKGASSFSSRRRRSSAAQRRPRRSKARSTRASRASSSKWSSTSSRSSPACG